MSDKRIIQLPGTGVSNSGRHDQAVSVAKNLTKAQGVILITYDRGALQFTTRWPNASLDKIPSALRAVADQYEERLRGILLGKETTAESPSE